jgi:hypothetical protein
MGIKPWITCLLIFGSTTEPLRCHNGSVVEPDINICVWLRREGLARQTCNSCGGDGQHHGGLWRQRRWGRTDVAEAGRKGAQTMLMGGLNVVHVCQKS